MHLVTLVPDKHPQCYLEAGRLGRKTISLMISLGNLYVFCSFNLVDRSVLIISEKIKFCLICQSVGQLISGRRWWKIIIIHQCVLRKPSFSSNFPGFL